MSQWEQFQYQELAQSPFKEIVRVTKVATWHQVPVLPDFSQITDWRPPVETPFVPVVVSAVTFTPSINTEPLPLDQALESVIVGPLLARPEPSTDWLVQNPDQVLDLEPVTLWTEARSDSVLVASIDWLVQNPDQVDAPEPPTLQTEADVVLRETAPADWLVQSPDPLFIDLLIYTQQWEPPTQPAPSAIDWLVQHPDSQPVPEPTTMWTEIDVILRQTAPIDWLIQAPERPLEGQPITWDETRPEPVAPDVRLEWNVLGPGPTFEDAYPYGIQEWSVPPGIEAQPGLDWLTQQPDPQAFEEPTQADAFIWHFFTAPAVDLSIAWMVQHPEPVFLPPFTEAMEIKQPVIIVLKGRVVQILTSGCVFLFEIIDPLTWASASPASAFVAAQMTYQPSGFILDPDPVLTPSGWTKDQDGKRPWDLI